MHHENIVALLDCQVRNLFISFFSFSLLCYSLCRVIGWKGLCVTIYSVFRYTRMGRARDQTKVNNLFLLGFLFALSSSCLELSLPIFPFVRTPRAPYIYWICVWDFILIWGGKEEEIPITGESLSRDELNE